MVLEAVIGAGEGAHCGKDGATVLEDVDASGGVGAGIAEAFDNELQGSVGVAGVEVVDLVRVDVHFFVAAAGDAAASGDDGLGEYLSAEDTSVGCGLATAGEPVTDGSVCAGGGVGVVEVEGVQQVGQWVEFGGSLVVGHGNSSCQMGLVEQEGCGCCVAGQRR